jgi:hypothetical protein
VDAPGSDVAVAIDPDQRHLDVFERVAFPAPGVSRLEFDTPDVSELTRTLGRRSVPVVEDLQVQLGDRVVPVTDAGGGRLTAQVPDGRPVRTAVLRYRLDGALFQAPNSPARRYYGVVTPLAAGTSLGAGRPVQVRVVGGDVRNVTCPLASAPLCGQPQGSAWTARLPSGSGPVVLLQLTLPGR